MKKLFLLLALIPAFANAQTHADTLCNDEVDKLALCIGGVNDVPDGDTIFIFYQVKGDVKYGFYFNTNGKKSTLRKVMAGNDEECTMSMLDPRLLVEVTPLLKRAVAAAKSGDFMKGDGPEPDATPAYKLKPCEGYTQIRLIAGETVEIWGMYDSDKTANIYYKALTTFVADGSAVLKKLK